MPAHSPAIRWKRSAKGNLWTRLEDGTSATVFTVHRDYGEVYKWVVGREGSQPRFSPEPYDTEEEALVALVAALEALGLA